MRCVGSAMDRRECRLSLYFSSYSESDFKHALSWQIQQDHPDVRVRQEVGNLIEGPDRRYVDIWLPDSGTAIELKYLTRAGVITHEDEEFRLRDQSAQDAGRYGFCLDIARLEGIIGSGRARDGYTILLTNDYLYWNPPRKLLPACLCDTSPEQLARTFTLANDLSGGTLLLRSTGMFCRRL